MTHDIDASFRLKKEASLARNKKARWRKVYAALGFGAAACVAAFFYITKDDWSVDGFDGDLELTAPFEDVPADAPVYVPAIVDLAGDPMVISLGGDAGAAPRTRSVDRPTDLLEPGISAKIEVLSDVMVTSSERFMTTIPSSQEDFAFFQAQRAAVPISYDANPQPASSGQPPAVVDEPQAEAPIAAPDDPPATLNGGDAPLEGSDAAPAGADSVPDGAEVAPEDPGIAPGELAGEPDDAAAAPDGTNAEPRDLAEAPVGSDVPPALDDSAAGWGETIDEGEASLPEFQKTQIENNTSVAFTTPEAKRYRSSDDVFVRVHGSRSLDSVVTDNRFSAEDARAAGEALKTLLGKDTLEAGYVLALRGRRDSATAQPQLMQLSVYAKEDYVGTLARDAAGKFVIGADPWVREDLFHYSDQPDTNAVKRQYRLLDAIYSTAARNNVPTGVIGEAIMYLSRGQDLNAFATPDDRFILMFSETGRDDKGGGRVLYAAVKGPERNIECFVYREASGDFACVTNDDKVHSLTVINGMVTPVNGVMTSTFGPRKHPILKTVRIHKGVDWAAPIGTPIFAAFDGKIAFRGDGGSYGNLVRISHAGGRESRYAHMSKFAPNIAEGQEVKAGTVIGYIGTTGLSTGPHLHFELYQGAEAIDPLGKVTIVASSGGASESGKSDSGAVEKLTDRIVHVESGGNSKAKNPLSTATGLGQFIESTWLRMMRTYRPDLSRTLSREDQLALRFDPTISREMVSNLAREGESYLRARGHQITAGRLYLCHFLGMEGAHIILSANQGSMVLDVMGQGVVGANPFLRNMTAADVVDWAERKMNRGSGGGKRAPAAPTVTKKEVVQSSPEFEKYKAAIIALVQSQAQTL